MKPLSTTDSLFGYEERHLQNITYPFLSNVTANIASLSSSLSSFSSEIVADAKEVRELADFGKNSKPLTATALQSHKVEGFQFLKTQTERVSNAEKSFLEVANIAFTLPSLYSTPSTALLTEKNEKQRRKNSINKDCVSKKKTDAMPITDLSELCRSLHAANSKRLLQIEECIRQYGYQPLLRHVSATTQEHTICRKDHPAKTEDRQLQCDQEGAGLLTETVFANQCVDQVYAMKAEIGLTPIGHSLGVGAPLDTLLEGEYESDTTATPGSLSGRSVHWGDGFQSPTPTGITGNGSNYTSATPSTPVTPTLASLQLSETTAQILAGTVTRNSDLSPSFTDDYEEVEEPLRRASRDAEIQALGVEAQQTEIFVKNIASTERTNTKTEDESKKIFETSDVYGEGSKEPNQSSRSTTFHNDCSQSTSGMIKSESDYATNLESKAVAAISENQPEGCVSTATVKATQVGDAVEATHACATIDGTCDETYETFDDTSDMTSVATVATVLADRKRVIAEALVVPKPDNDSRKSNGSAGLLPTLNAPTNATVYHDDNTNESQSIANLDDQPSYNEERIFDYDLKVIEGKLTQKEANVFSGSLRRVTPGTFVCSKEVESQEFGSNEREIDLSVNREMCGTAALGCFESYFSPSRNPQQNLKSFINDEMERCEQTDLAPSDRMCCDDQDEVSAQSVSDNDPVIQSNVFGGFSPPTLNSLIGSEDADESMLVTPVLSRYQVQLLNKGTNCRVTPIEADMMKSFQSPLLKMVVSGREKSERSSNNCISFAKEANDRTEWKEFTHSPSHRTVVVDDTLVLDTSCLTESTFIEKKVCLRTQFFGRTSLIEEVEDEADLSRRSHLSEVADDIDLDRCWCEEAKACPKTPTVKLFTNAKYENDDDSSSKQLPTKKGFTNTGRSANDFPSNKDAMNMLHGSKVERKSVRPTQILGTEKDLLVEDASQIIFCSDSKTAGSETCNTPASTETFNVPSALSRTPLAAAWIAKNMSDEKDALLKVLSGSMGHNFSAKALNRLDMTTNTTSRNMSTDFAKESSAAHNYLSEICKESTIAKEVAALPKQYFIKALAKDEYEAAPRVVKMQVSMTDVNAAADAINSWLSVKNANAKQETLEINESDACQVLGEMFNQKKSKSLLMSLCIWRRMMMMLSDINGKGKRYVVVVS